MTVLSVGGGGGGGGFILNLLLVENLVNNLEF